jgi:hypothetical protein
MRVLSDLCMILPNVVPYKVFRKSARFGQSSSITETFFASQRGMEPRSAGRNRPSFFSHPRGNARDADSRRAAIDELWDKDGVFIDPGGVHEGVEKINAIIELLFTQFEGCVFSVRGPGQSMYDVGRLPWSYGPPDDPQRLTGTDVGVTKDGKLTALYVFIDPPSQT